MPGQSLANGRGNVVTRTSCWTISIGIVRGKRRGCYLSIRTVMATQNTSLDRTLKIRLTMKADNDTRLSIGRFSPLHFNWGGPMCSLTGTSVSERLSQGSKLSETAHPCTLALLTFGSLITYWLHQIRTKFMKSRGRMTGDEMRELIRRHCQSNRAKPEELAIEDSQAACRAQNSIRAIKQPSDTHGEGHRGSVCP